MRDAATRPEMIGVGNDEVLDPAIELAGVNQSSFCRPAAGIVHVDPHERVIPSVAPSVFGTGVAHDRGGGRCHCTAGVQAPVKEAPGIAGGR